MTTLARQGSQTGGPATSQSSSGPSASPAAAGDATSIKPSPAGPALTRPQPSPGHASGANGDSGIRPIPPFRGNGKMMRDSLPGRGANIAFGTVNSPHPALSSSPAAPSATGAHLSGSVKSFGSIAADGPTDGPGGHPPSSSEAPSPANAKQLDMHALFGARPRPNGTAQTVKSPPSVQSSLNSPFTPPDRRQSLAGSSPSVNGVPQAVPQSYQMAGMPSQSGHLRPPSTGVPTHARSPTLGQSIPVQGNVPTQFQPGFRPPNQMTANGFHQAQIRPNGIPQNMQYGMQRPPMMMSQHGLNAYGLHAGPQGSYPIMSYPNQAYYDGTYNMYPPQGYSGMPQWATNQNQSNPPFNVPVSPQPPSQTPSMIQASPSSQAPHLPTSGSVSPAPTPPSRPNSLLGHQATPSNVSVSSIPSTPSRPLVPPSMAAPAVSAPSASQPTGDAPITTPRASRVLKFTRPDGTPLDMKAAAAAVSAPKPASTPVQTPPEPAPPVETAQVAEPPKKKLPALPVMVRIESEDQKKTRLAEEEQRARIKKEEEKEEAERKERKERLAREEAERHAEQQAEQQAKQQANEERQKAEDAAAVTKATEPEPSAAPSQSVVADAVLEEKKPEPISSEAETPTQPPIPNEPKPAPDRAQITEPVEAPKDAEDVAADSTTTLLTPVVPSNPTSPLASPALAAANLPPKPAVANGGNVPQRRPAPAVLDISAVSPNTSERSKGGPGTAFGSARPIVDLQTVSYPGTLKSPNVTLNVDATPGKYRYDRDFLLQFMHVCREKPENLPPLDEIGLEADSSSGFGGNRSSRGARGSVGGPSTRGAAPTGLGIGGLNQNRSSFPTQGMGSFTMGNFGSGSLRGTTSEERYNRSVTQGRQGGMTRTPSQGGPGGLPLMGLSSSRSGVNRSQRGAKRLPQDGRGLATDPDVAPLVSTSNSWAKARPTGDDESSPAYRERKVKALLNKLTAEKFESISAQILEWANKSAHETDGMTLKLVIKQIFEKATDEAHWSSMYARLCRLLLDRLDPAITETFDGKPVSGGMLFRKYLLGRCQVDFETGWKAREDAATAAAAKSEEDRERLAQHEKNKEGGEESAEVAMLSDEYYAAQKAKRRGLGLVQLIGELYNLDMLGKGVIRQCFIKLLGNIETPDEEDIESSVKLLTTVGRPFEASSSENMEIVFERLNIVLKGEAVSSRMKFMIMDVFDLRKAGWQQRNKTGGVMTIAEVHQAAAREQAEKTAAAAQAARESISRGGSRPGYSRRDGPQPGEWQSVATTSRPLQRPTDFSNIGRNISSTGMPSAPTFGPTSVFSKGRGKNAVGSTTPPLSRQASTSNMNKFSALGDEAGEHAADRRPSADAATESQPQRKKLNLQPRSVPVASQDDNAETVEEDGNAQGDAEGENEEATMSLEAVEAKINRDMTELWGEKDSGGSRNPDDVVEYLRSLPEEHRPLLVRRLVDDVFRISKPKDAEIVGKAWETALQEEVIRPEMTRAAIDARMPGLDDDAIDFPQAYLAIAILMRSASLSPEEIDTCASKIEVEGEPRITPKTKLEKALASLDQ